MFRKGTTAKLASGKVPQMPTALTLSIFVHLPGNSGGNTMSETDLKQGPGANGASGQDEQISEAQGEGRSTEVPPYEPAAVDRAASRRRARIIAGGTVVAAGALAFIRKVRQAKTRPRARRRWSRIAVLPRRSRHSHRGSGGRSRRRACR